MEQTLKKHSDTLTLDKLKYNIHEAPWKTGPVEILIPKTT